MGQSKYIYMLCGKYSFRDVLYTASTDIKDIFNTLGYEPDAWVCKMIYVIKSGERMTHNIPIGLGDEKLFRKYEVPHIYDAAVDQEEIKYVTKCHEEWCKERDRSKKEAEQREKLRAKRESEEHDRKEYERLKRKFEKYDPKMGYTNNQRQEEP